MNVSTFAKSLKLAGALMIFCACLLVAKFSVSLALVVTWVGISLFTTSLLVHPKKGTPQRSKTVKSKRVRASRSRKVEA